jgi:hypothetical protein
MTEGSTVEAYLEKFDFIVAQLAHIDKLISDKHLIHIVLKALPALWAPFKSTFGTLLEYDK